MTDISDDPLIGPRSADANVSEPGPTGVQPEVAPSGEVAQAEPEPEDTRQEWFCVTPEGQRTVRNGVACAPFRSLDHEAYPPAPVHCPACGSMSVIKAEHYRASPLARV